MRSLNSEIDTSVAKGNELLQRGKTSILHRNGRSKKSERDLRFQSSQLHLQHHQPVTNEILNPFVHRLELSTNYEKLKTAFLTISLLPIRLAVITTLVIMAWLLACIGLYGLTEEDLRKAPLKGWRRSKVVPWLCLLGRWTYQAGGMKIVVRGRQATRAEAPILVVAPHSSFIDGGIVYVTDFPSIIVRRESLDPYIGKLINYTQPVYVWRDDPNSRHNTVREIIERATSKQDWPQVMIFPEGTCTNRSCLITFKSGAFYPGVPVQPVCIRYPNKLDTVTWTWEGPGALKLLWLTLTQINSSCEIEFLPVYKPNEAEKLDPKLYANNVRLLMAKALKIPVSDYTYEDCQIISKAHQLQLSGASSIVKVHKLRSKLGLLQNNTEQKLVQKKCQKFPEAVNFYQFTQLLRLEENSPSAKILFKIHDKNNRGLIDFEEYLFMVLAVAKAKNEYDLVEIAFQVCSSNPKSHSLSKQELRKVLKFSLCIGEEESDRIFQQLQVEHNCNDIDYEMVLAILSSRPQLQEAKRKKKI